MPKRKECSHPNCDHVYDNVTGGKGMNLTDAILGHCMTEHGGALCPGMVQRDTGSTEQYYCRGCSKVFETRQGLAGHESSCLSADPKKHHKKIVAEIIQEHGRMEPLDLYSEYENRVGPRGKSQRTIREYLQELEKDGTIFTTGNKRSTTYHASVSA